MPIRPLYLGRNGAAARVVVAVVDEVDAAAVAAAVARLVVGWICSLTFAVSSGKVRNSAEHAAIAEAANDVCRGSGGPVGGGLIFLKFTVKVVEINAFVFTSSFLFFSLQS